MKRENRFCRDKLGLISSQLRLVALAIFFSAEIAFAGNFYSGTSPANVPWPNGVVPYEFTNTLSVAQQQTYLHGLREWELAANVKFVSHSNQTRWILFTFNSNNFNNVSSGYDPQVISISSLSRAQVTHEMGHSFGFLHENIRPDQTNFLTVISNNVSSGNLGNFQIDPTSVTNGNYDFESVMHLGWDFASVQPGVLATQRPKPPYVPRYEFRMGNLALSPGDRAALRFLYGPPVSTLTNIVTTTADIGPGSLRAALYYVTDNPGAIVRFNIPTNDPGYSNGVFTVRLTGHLPPLVTNGMVIDGSTQPGFTNKPVIVVDGSQILPETLTSNTGLLIYSANNQIKNISFRGFNWNGLTFRYADSTNNTVAGCWLGLDSTGSNAAPNAHQGIYIDRGASRNLIGGTNALARNILSGNGEYGLYISDSNTLGNTISGNFIGTDFSGLNAVSNSFGGALLVNATHDNLIGGTNAGARNVISGNFNFGIWIGAANNNVLQGNWIGLNAAGAAALPNSFLGVYVVDAAQSNLITGNVLSGHPSEGIRLSGSGTSWNRVQGNFIGTDSTGFNAVANSYAGATIFFGATSNTIGGTTVSARNIIGGGSYGIVVGGPGTSGNLIQGNYIGLAPDGSTLVPSYYGVLFSDRATNNTLGGTVSGARNIISGNLGAGVFLGDLGTSGNFIQGNYIGPDAVGSNARPNSEGIYIEGASENVIGGPAVGAGNVISGNTFRGIYASGTNTSGNLIQGNFIGTQANGTNALGNGWDGFVFFNGASSNVVGLARDGSGAGNKIAFNGLTGVYVGSDNGNNSVGNTIRGNTIFSNGRLSINLVGGIEDFNGVTANDIGDADTGANNLQNYPVITSAVASGSSTVISGTLDSATNKTFLIDVYRSPTPNQSGYSEGQIYLGSLTVTNGGDGSSVFTLTASGNFAGQYFSATATDQTSGDTSEFNVSVVATNGPSAPRFIGPFSMTSTGFNATISLTVGQNYRVQATTNLGANPIPWIDLTNFSAGATNFIFADRSATNYAARFYRVVSP